MAKKVTEKIKLWGVVQGVGFRPFIAKIAQKYNIDGQVLNIGGLVEIQVTDYRDKIDDFIIAIKEEKPKPAEIVHIKRENSPFKDFKGFTILKSLKGGHETAMIPADLAICPDCLSDMRNKDDHRYNHPFISCMICGPRYNIIDRFPYDRENTSMVDFTMCHVCENEYTSINDRRYHAQTISCHNCGPKLKCQLQKVQNQEDIMEEAVSILKEGGVIAFKSMGGYNLMADPFNEEAVSSLREIKKRDYKPFAIMFSSAEQVEKHCILNETEKTLLSSSARPILLLEKKNDKIATNGIIGAFLPSMGAQYILLEKFNGPVIVTSANLSEHPIVKDEKEIFEIMAKEPCIAGVFYNDRKIRIRMDDSVARVVDEQPQIIRRSKGYAPVPLYVEGAREEVLATGGQLKNSFAISKENFVYISQFFGDMDTVENQKIYEENVARMKSLFRVKPKKIVCDMHPLYYTTKFAEAYAQENKIPLMKVQHHHAHVASVMAEHNLEGKVIGVAFDGTGYGQDGAIWGGEFLLCEGATYERLFHLKYVNLIGGDSSMKEGWKSAVSHMLSWERDAVKEGEFQIDISNIIFYANENKTLEKYPLEIVNKGIKNKVNVIQSSSMGRLFDSVAAMLNICQYNTYEGQCAMMLEESATRALRDETKNAVDVMALDFHNKVINKIVEQCLIIKAKTGADKVALTGGVFQNKLLMEGTVKKLRKKGFTPYYNISVSPNDGGIALGQSYLATRQEKCYND